MILRIGHCFRSRMVVMGIQPRVIPPMIHRGVPCWWGVVLVFSPDKIPRMGFQMMVALVEMLSAILGSGDGSHGLRMYPLRVLVMGHGGRGWTHFQPQRLEGGVMVRVMMVMVTTAVNEGVQHGEEVLVVLCHQEAVYDMVFEVLVVRCHQEFIYIVMLSPGVHIHSFTM